MRSGTDNNLFNVQPTISVCKRNSVVRNQHRRSGAIGKPIDRASNRVGDDPPFSFLGKRGMLEDGCVPIQIRPQIAASKHVRFPFGTRLYVFSDHVFQQGSHELMLMLFVVDAANQPEAFTVGHRPQEGSLRIQLRIPRRRRHTRATGIEGRHLQKMSRRTHSSEPAL